MTGQLTLDLAIKTWGGKRAGAGRPRKVEQHDSPHVARPKHAGRLPLHVVLRTVVDAPNLRSAGCYAAISRALSRCRRDDFRVIHVSIQRTHLHFIVEANNTAARTRGMRALGVSIARAINRTTNRRGKLFAHRYHATPIASPRQMFHTLDYVLNNWRHHDEDRASTAYLDRYSSALAFDGWNLTFATPINHVPLPVRAPTTWLATLGWRRHGHLDCHHRPGPKRAR